MRGRNFRVPPSNANWKTSGRAILRGEETCCHRKTEARETKLSQRVGSHLRVLKFLGVFTTQAAGHYKWLEGKAGMFPVLLTVRMLPLTFRTPGASVTLCVATCPVRKEVGRVYIRNFPYKNLGCSELLLRLRWLSKHSQMRTPPRSHYPVSQLAPSSCVLFPPAANASDWKLPGPGFSQT